ncbi:hypothetical protein HII28_19200 [Planctomonas sp. JC2975]|uniref:hypothetical protein n=1 Tax=Planctomonas sp. JC2975 TaxID=2729626 RepID=UPI001474C104|nr:hypothetical protein [Planctomonas sp. JC2975]NNC13994.1 hypothetical protein [Planctomonas sp. JC2975]
MTVITPRLTVSGGKDARDFSPRTLGAEVVERGNGADGRISHAMVDVGGANPFLSREYSL